MFKANQLKSQQVLQFCNTHLHACIVAGCTQSGKTVWVKYLLENAQKTISPPPQRIIWYYGQWQPSYFDMLKTMPGIEFNKGIPDDIDKGNYLDQGVYKNGRWNASESFETCVMRGPPHVVRKRFHCIFVFQDGGLLERGRIGNCHQFKWQFCGSFLVMSAHYINFIKALILFKFATKNELVNFAFRH
jgi:hypothetical protein